MASERKPKGSAKVTKGSVKAPVSALGAKATQSSRKAVAPPPPPGGRPSGLIWLTCRECYEDWTLDPSKATDVICCPACEHRAQAPSDDLLHQVNVYKRIESKNLKISIASLFVGVAAMVAWTIRTANPNHAADDTQFWAPVGAAFVAMVLTVIFGAKYEKSRYETYF